MHNRALAGPPHDHVVQGTGRTNSTLNRHSSCGPPSPSSKSVRDPRQSPLFQECPLIHGVKSPSMKGSQHEGLQAFRESVLDNYVEMTESTEASGGEG
jgi:hypothetical protein